ncbi:MAG: hypothetical protein AAFQ98_20640 [Bacteroidota bacterium]
MTTSLSTILILILELIPALQEPSQSTCGVNLEELAGTYKGDCRQGLAHGEGTAEGTHRYQGEWRKGFPHGVGLYTYTSGDTYKGAFDRGRRDGQGKMTFCDGEVKEGIWVDDRFVGNYAEAYEYIEKPESGNYELRRQGDEENRIEVELTNRGMAFDPQDLNFVASTGVPIRYTNRFGWEGVEFPCTIEVSYTVPSISGQRISFKVIVKEPGEWKMAVRH